MSDKCTINQHLINCISRFILLSLLLSIRCRKKNLHNKIRILFLQLSDGDLSGLLTHWENVIEMKYVQH